MALTPIADDLVQTVSENSQQVLIKNQRSLNQQRAEANASQIVDAKELQQFADTSVLTVLQRQPGVNLVNGQISMRGLPANYTQILINGEPAPAGFNLDSVNPAQLERIEINSGTRADQSSQAIAGSINLIFKSTSVNLPKQIQVQLQHGKTQTNRLLAHDINGHWAGLEYGLRVQAQDNLYSGLEKNYEQQVDLTRGEVLLDRQIHEQGDSQLRRFNVQARLSAKPSSIEQWQVQSWLEQSHNQAQGHAQESMQRGEANDYPDNAFFSTTRQTQARLEAQWKRRLNADLRMQNKLAAWYSDRDIDYVFNGQTVDAGSLFQRQVVSNANEKKWQQSSQFNWNFQAQHSLALGWSLAQIQREEQRLQTDTSRLAVSALLSEQATGTQLDERYRAKINQVALYLQDEWDISEVWRSYLGLRWESLSTEVDSHASLQHEGLIKNRAAVWSPVFNLLWRNPEAAAKKQTQQWRLALARSYKAPEPRQIIPRRYTVNNGNNPANADYAGNPELQPELAWNADLAYEYSWGEGTWLSLSGYTKRIQNVVVNDLVQYQQRWLVHPANLAAASVQGLELDLRLPLQITRVKAKLSMRLHAGYHQSHLQNASWDAARLPGQLPYSWSYLLDYQRGPVQASLNWQVQAGGKSQANAFVSNQQTQTNRIELAWHYRFSPQLKISFMHSQSLRGDGTQITTYQDQHTRWQRQSINADEHLSRLQLEFNY